MARNDTIDQRYTATTGEIDQLDDEAAVEELLTGESSTVSAEDLPQEFDDLADAAEHGGQDRDDERLARKAHELEARDLTDVDEEGLEGHLKTLHFEEAEGEDGVDPQATRPDAPHRKG
ncbi:hypothetical protein [Zymobacter sp. IVIA_12111.31 C1]|uniref:hypothetical protein n=1 Tax=Zymobacter sp. IVIA_12111.31 C1 TaxID=3394854 RepID=UPI0039C43011